MPNNSLEVVWQPGDLVEAVAQASHHLGEVGEVIE